MDGWMDGRTDRWENLWVDGLIRWTGLHINYMVRFEVLTARSMKMVVIWGAAPCSLVHIDQNVIVVLTMKAVNTSAMLVSIQQNLIPYPSDTQQTKLSLHTNISLVCCVSDR